MINVAIVEDEKPAAELIGSYLQEFGRQEEEEFSVRVFGDAVSFLENYKPDFDLVFMDIMMPSIDGMRAAKKLRERDRNVQIIFVTSMSQFAVKGYEVAALDFIVKPVSYFDFCIKMRRAVFAVRSCDGRSVVVPAEGGELRIFVRDLQYIEVSGHNCRYHIAPHRVAEGRNTIRGLSALLQPYHFMRCNSCYLVNLKYVNSVKEYTVDVAGEKLKVSQPKKKEFLRALNNYIGGGYDV